MISSGGSVERTRRNSGSTNRIASTVMCRPIDTVSAITSTLSASNARKP
jgi:hypothetical protein